MTSLSAQLNQVYRNMESPWDVPTFNLTADQENRLFPDEWMVEISLYVLHSGETFATAHDCRETPLMNFIPQGDPGSPNCWWKAEKLKAY